MSVRHDLQGTVTCIRPNESRTEQGVQALHSRRPDRPQNSCPWLLSVLVSGGLLKVLNHSCTSLYHLNLDYRKIFHCSTGTTLPLLLFARLKQKFVTY